MRAHPRGLGLADQSLGGGELERQHDAERHRLAVQQALREAGAGFQRVTEGVPEIEQCALAAFALVARHHPGLAAAANRDGVFARGAAREHVLPVLLQPGEERGIGKQSVFERPRHSRRGIPAAAACRAARCRRPPKSADGRRRRGSCPVAGIDRRSCRRPRSRPARAASSAPARNRGRGGRWPRQSRRDRRSRRRRAR